MNTKITHSTRAALIALLAGAAVAPALIGAPAGKENHAGRREPKTRHSPVEYNQPDLQVRPASEDPRGRSARELLGMDVRGNNGEKLGDLHDLIVDANTGKVTHAVVASGGVFGIGSSLRAVPIEAVAENVNADDLSINMNKTRWKQAPVFTEEQLISFNRGDRIPELREFYGQGPARHEPSSPHASPRNRDRQSPSELVLVSDIRGKDVHSEGREIGEIDDVIVQLHARSAAALFDPDDNYVGGGQDYLVPLAKLTGFHTETLGTSISPDEFSAARPLSESATADTNNYTSSIHLWPGYFPGVGVTPYDTTTYALMENTRHDNDRALDDARRQDADRDRVARAQPPIDAVRRAVRAEAPDAQQDVRVTAEDDKLVLRGTVPSENIKDRIEDRAEEAAAGWDVDSELRVAQSER